MANLKSRWTFAKAVDRLNSHNLLDLWTSSCVLSCVEYFDSWEHPFNFVHPMLHIEKINLFTRAILESRSSNYKNKFLVDKDIPYIFNALNDTTSRVEYLSGEDDPNLRILRTLSVMAHQQIRHQESVFFERIGRTYAMLHVIPTTFKDELTQKMRSSFFDLTTTAEIYLGMSIPEFLTIGYSIIALMLQRYTSNITISDDMRQYTSLEGSQGVKRRARVLTDLIESSRSIRSNFIFSIKDLNLQQSSALTTDKIQRFLQLTCRTTQELRELLRNDPVYKQGLIPDRLNPLERFPIVQLDQDKFIIPNLRSFDVAATEVIHYILQGKFPDNQYNQLRGYIQEIYLRLYLEKRLPNITIIPEVSYLKNKNRIEGPDMTIIDNSSQRLIALESKAKRMRVITRVNPDDGHYLQEDLTSALRALEKLPSKINDLYSGMKEYDMCQRLINSTSNNTPIALVVLGDGVYFLSELLHYQLMNDPMHFMHSYEYPYCIMRIDVFEKLVEVASYHDEPLSKLLQEYFMKSQSTNISEASAERLSPYTIQRITLAGEYAQDFFREMFRDIGIKANDDEIEPSRF